MKTIKVTQNASGKFAPDIVVVRAELTAEDKKSVDAARALREKADTTMRALAAAGIKTGETVTSGGGITAVRRESKTLFCAHADVKLKMSITDERINAVTEALEKCGLAWRQHYELADTSPRSELIAQAVEAAKEDALTIAEAAGVRLGELAGVEYAASFGGGARMMRAVAAEAVAARPEDIEMVETVTCEWEIQK